MSAQGDNGGAGSLNVQHREIRGPTGLSSLSDAGYGHGAFGGESAAGISCGTSNSTLWVLGEASAKLTAQEPLARHWEQYRHASEVQIMKKHIEFDIGNTWCVRTEIEDEPLSTVEGMYVRLWLGQTVIIVSTNEGVKRMRKGRRAFKLLIGIAGV